ncbi:protein YgfX [Paraburkholderia sediminicola]|uniref:protein YgfX n=1 Tax=Paraburkholderia sediminicola TaxID=458836 RepID=UPI0038B85E58
MRAALGVFVLIATLAAYICFASHLGTWQAVPLALSVLALLTLCAVKHERAQPVALKIGPDGLSAWDRGGSLLMQGRIAGCSQWSGRLLVLALVPDQGRSRTLLLAADALPAPVFRELAVLGRHGAGA